MPPHSRTILGHLRRLASPPVSDAVLLARWIDQRDEAAFADLMARHGPMVLGVCRRVLGDVQHAEDAFQATFLVLSRKAAKLRRPEALASFLYGVALRLARKSRGAIRRRMMASPPLLAEPVDPHADPLDVLSGRELLALLDEEVARLPEAHRLPLLLCVLQGRTVEEAAQLLGWSSGSVRGRLARGRERLRERLRRRGLGPTVATLVLLAPAVVPDRLRAESIRNLAAPVSPAVNALAAGSTSTLKVKAICLGLLVVAVGVGIGLPFLGSPVPEAPSTAAPAAPPAQAKNEPRRDRYGDALPPGAVARLGTLRFRAPGEIESLAFAPDGKTVAVSSRGGMYLFDAASGTRIKRLPSPGPAWRPEDLLVFSPDGKRLIGRGQKTVGQSIKPVVRVWELAVERKPQEYDLEHTIWLGWSATNEPLAVCLEQGALRLHELAAGRLRRFACQDLPKPYIGQYIRCACSPAGQTLVVADEKWVVHVWDAATGRERCTLRPKGDQVCSLDLSPDGSRLATITAQTVQLWDAATGKALYAVDFKSSYSCVRFTPDGKTLAILDFWKMIRFWDTATGRERGRTQGRFTFTESFAFSSDGKTLVTAERHSDAICLWDVTTGVRKPQPLGHTCRPHGIFSPDGCRLATSGGLDGSIRFWDPATGKPIADIRRTGQWARDIAYSSDGRSLYSTWTDENLWVSDAATGEQQHVMQLDDAERPDTYQSAISMNLSDDGKTLIAFSYYYPKQNGAGPRYEETLITGWNTSTRMQLFRRRRPRMSSWLAVSADARVLASAYPEDRSKRPAPASGPMRLEDVKTGELLLAFPTLQGQTWPLAFSRDGRLLASNNSDPKRADKDGQSRNNLRLWETMTAAEVLSLPAADFNCTAFSRGGALLAVAAPAQEIVVWDLARGRERQRFKGFDAEVIDLAFSHDGRRLISGLADSTLLVWDVGSHEVPPSGKLGAEAVSKAWTDLARTDAPRAFRARWVLATAPEEAIPLLTKHLHAAQPPDTQRLRRLLTDLESEEFTVREKAQRELEELGELAEPALRQTMASKPTPEVRRRVQALLERMRGPVTRPETLRSLRAVAVLEDIGTPIARRLLEDLAKGAPEARLTREATASLRRLSKK